MSGFENLFSEFPLDQSSLEISENAAEIAAESLKIIDSVDENDAAWIEKIYAKILTPITDSAIDDGEIETETISFGAANEANDARSEGYHIQDAAKQWHRQSTDYTCAVCSQEFIINEFTDFNVSEAELINIAKENGWLDEGGTTPESAGKILEYFGIDTQKNYEGTYEDLKNALDCGGRVLVAVDSAVLWTDGYGNYPLYGADHAIEVIGIDDSDPENITIIVNDSGDPEGCAKSYSYDEFMEAWSVSGGFMVSAFPNSERRNES